MGGTGLGNEASQTEAPQWSERTTGPWQARAPARPRVAGRGGAQPT